MQAIELDGLKKSEASELFNISRNTINLWFQRKAETGDVQVKQKVGLGNPGKITDWQKFQTFVRRHEDRTQANTAALWDGKISSRTISRGLEKIGSSRQGRINRIAGY